MKYTREKIRECVAWVEDNGVYPQRCGAPAKVFCEAMGISEDTLARWMDKAEFADAIKKANEVFKQKAVTDVKNALVQRALGYKAKRTRLSNDNYTDPKTGEVRTRKSLLLTEDVIYPPDTAAAIFLLTNLDSENWKNKQNTELDGDIAIEKPRIVFRDAPAEDSLDE